ncbi:hypothetical protein LCGC14_0779050 [marine sediment metagenome]|uniref:Uncharacterized protein n=1 Tax=marine sediment metagenome TaxID=412755 RepID=A0A0F9SFZ1_9ZZZZ
MVAPIAAVALLGGMAVATSVPLVIGSALEPVSTLIRQQVWPLMPVQKPDPNTLVIARLKGVIDDGVYKADMLTQGFSAETADVFLKAAEQILGPGEQLRMVIRGIIGPDQMASELARLGISNESADNLAQLAETLLDPNTLIQAKFRGGPGAGKFDSVMTQLGYTSESASAFEEVSKIIGGPSDMIRWAVREVFTPEIVQQLGLADEFPTEFVTEAAKIGMEENIAKNEWMAHWVLPSIQQGFEMLHRRAKKPDGSIFVIEDMERLLRVQDVMPFFRGLVTQIAFNPYTRVDVRRMHKMGVLNREQTKSAYMDIGFDEDKAETMTAFTVQFNTESERDLTKTEIMRAFDRGVINESATVDLLSDVGIPAEAAQIIIATQLAKVSMDTTDELSDIEIDRYIDGLITEDELQDALTTFDLTASQTELLMAKARRKRLRSRKLPPAATVVEWRRNGQITDERANDLLDRMGYDEVFRRLMLGKKEKLSSRADILNWLDRKLIDKPRAVELLIRLGYANEVIEFMVDKPSRNPSRADVTRWFKKELISEEAAREMLTEMDFAPDLIDLYIEESIPLPKEV